MNARPKSRLLLMAKLLCSVLLIANVAVLMRGMDDRDFRLADAVLCLMFSGLLIHLAITKSPTHSKFWIGFTAGILVVTLISYDQVNWWMATYEGAEGPLWPILEIPYRGFFSDEFLKNRCADFEYCTCSSCLSGYLAQHRDHYLRTAGATLNLFVAFAAGLALASWGHFQRKGEATGDHPRRENGDIARS